MQAGYLSISHLFSGAPARDGFRSNYDDANLSTLNIVAEPLFLQDGKKTGVRG